MPKLGNNLDFNKNEAQNITLHKLAAAPSNPINGQMYYNTVDKKAYIYDGSNWVDMTSQGKIYNGTAPIVIDGFDYYCHKNRKRSDVVNRQDQFRWSYGRHQKSKKSRKCRQC